MTPSEPVLLPLTNGLFATVDRRDYERVAAHRWAMQLDSQGKGPLVRQQLPYTADSRNSGQYGAYLHRFILGVENPWETVRFRNRNKLDCTRENMYVISYVSRAKNSKRRGPVERPDPAQIPHSLPSPCGGIVATRTNKRCKSFYQYNYGGCRHYDKCLDACCHSYWPGFVAVKDMQDASH